MNMAKKRKTRSQKIRSIELRNNQISMNTKKITKHESHKAVSAKPKESVSQLHNTHTDLKRSLKIVGLLILGQILIWGILHVTHLDTKLYETINI